MLRRLHDLKNVHGTAIYNALSIQYITSLSGAEGEREKSVCKNASRTVVICSESLDLFVYVLSSLAFALAQTLYENWPAAFLCVLSNNWLINL